MGIEIIIIMIVIAVVMFFINGGGDIFGPNDETFYQKLADHQWHCERVVWSQPAAVKSGVFEGTADLVCEVQGLDKGGIGRLHAFFSDRVPQLAEQVYSVQPVLQGRKSGVSYDVAVKAKHDGKSTTVRGRTTLVSDGDIELVHTFKTEGSDARSVSRYLKDMETKVTVTSSLRRDWYRVAFSQAVHIDKPFLVGAGTFKDSIVEKLEAALRDKAQETLTSIANRL